MPVSPAIAAEHRFRVGRILINSMTARGKKQAIWNYIITHELASGTEFVMTPEGDLYIVLGVGHQVLQLPKAGRGGDKWFSYFHTMYGLSEHEDTTKFLYDALRHYAIEKGTRVELRRFAAVNQDTMTAYISAYDGRMYKIEDEDSIELVHNGTDGVFFADDDHGVHCEPDIGPHGLLLDRLITLNFIHGVSGITPEQQKMALIIWLFAVGLPDLMPTKPLLLLEGTKGSGKTFSCISAQLILLGREKPMLLERNKEDDFMVVLLRSPIALFDNVDSYIDWVPDKIAAYLTGVEQDKRKLFTDGEAYVIKPHAFVAVTTRNPASFRRDDVADRLIIMRLERREKFTSARRLKQQLLADRPQLFGEYLWFIGRIISEMRAMHVAGEVFGLDETHRMADYAALGRIIGKILGWTDEEVSETLLALQRERDAFINEEDPLSDLLGKWLTYRQKNSVGNIGRLIDLFKLCAELESLSQSASIPWKETPRSIAQKLRSTHIERQFRVDQINSDGKKSFRIWRHTDPKLEAV